jgi:hypothetical protein
MAWFALIVLVLLAFSFIYLRGENLSYLDTNVLPQPEGEPSEAHHEVVASLSEMAAVFKEGSAKNESRHHRRLGGIGQSKFF